MSKTLQTHMFVWWHRFSRENPQVGFVAFGSVDLGGP